eukprot:12127595-Alexandrium_andersonii.AAC.1
MWVDGRRVMFASPPAADGGPARADLLGSPVAGAGAQPTEAAPSAAAAPSAGQAGVLDELASFEAAADARAGPAPFDPAHPQPPDGRTADWERGGGQWARVTGDIPVDSAEADRLRQVHIARWMQEDAEAAAAIRSRAAQAAPQADHDPRSAAAWAAAPGPLLPPNDPRVSLAAGIQAGGLDVDVAQAGLEARAAAAAHTGTHPTAPPPKSTGGLAASVAQELAPGLRTAAATDLTAGQAANLAEFPPMPARPVPGDDSLVRAVVEGWPPQP